MRVLFLSQWAVNPYQRLLTAHLAASEAPLRLRTLLRPFRADVLHLQNVRSFLTAGGTFRCLLNIAVFVSRLCVTRAKIVWTVHDLQHHSKRHPRLDALVTRVLERLAHALIVHCESARTRFPNAFVIPHGHYAHYANTVSRAEARRRLGIADAKCVFLLFGWLRDYKGVPELVEAFTQLEGDAVLLLAGNGVPDDDIQLYMNACDAAVFPYREILTSGAVILAMSFGRACVAVRRGCIADVLDDEGAFLYENDLLGAMHNALKKRNDLAAMGAHNRTKALQWSWDVIAEKTLDVYRSVLNR